MTDFENYLLIDVSIALTTIKELSSIYSSSYGSVSDKEPKSIPAKIPIDDMNNLCQLATEGLEKLDKIRGVKREGVVND